MVAETKYAGVPGLSEEMAEQIPPHPQGGASPQLSDWEMSCIIKALTVAAVAVFLATLHSPTPWVLLSLVLFATAGLVMWLRRYYHRHIVHAMVLEKFQYRPDLYEPKVQYALRMVGRSRSGALRQTIEHISQWEAKAIQAGDLRDITSESDLIWR